MGLGGLEPPTSPLSGVRSNQAEHSLIALCIFIEYDHSMKNFIYITLCLSASPIFSEVNSWECGEFNGARIVAEDGTELGTLGPKWKTESIYNDSSEYSSSWSSESIFNENSDYGNSYSDQSVFNDSASKPPLILSEEGEEIGKLSVGPNWDSDRYDPYDIKYTCDWD